MPRKRVRSGIDQTLSLGDRACRDHASSRSASRSGLPLSSSGIASRVTTSRGAHDRGCAADTQSRAASSGPARRPSRPRPRRRPPPGGPTPRRGRRAPRPHARPGARAAARRPPGVGTLTPPLTTTSSSRPSTCSRPSSSSRPASEVRNHPSTSERGRQLGVAVVPLEEGRPADPDPAVRRRSPARPRPGDARRRRSRRRSPRSRTSPRRARPAPAARARSDASIGPPPSSTVRKVRSAVTSSGSSSIRCSWVGTSETNRGRRRRCGTGRRLHERRVLLEQDRLVPGHQGAADHLHAGDVRRAAAPAATGRWRRAGGPTPRPRPARPDGRGRRAWARRSTRTSRPRSARARRARPASRPARATTSRVGADDGPQEIHATNASRRWNNAVR